MIQQFLVPWLLKVIENLISWRSQCINSCKSDVFKLGEISDIEIAHSSVKPDLRFLMDLEINTRVPKRFFVTKFLHILEMTKPQPTFHGSNIVFDSVICWIVSLVHEKIPTWSTERIHIWPIYCIIRKVFHALYKVVHAPLQPYVNSNIAVKIVFIRWWWDVVAFVVILIAI